MKIFVEICIVYQNRYDMKVKYGGWCVIFLPISWLWKLILGEINIIKTLLNWSIIHAFKIRRKERVLNDMEQVMSKLSSSQQLQPEDVKTSLKSCWEFLGLLKIWEIWDIWEIYVICYTEEHVFVFYWYTLYIEQNITNIKYKIFRISHS